MTKHEVYRTTKGNLTFKPTKEHAYTIHSKTLLGAEHMLHMLKSAEKRLKNEDAI